MSKAAWIAAVASALLLYGLSELLSTISTFIVFGVVYLVGWGIVRAWTLRRRQRT